MLYKKIFKKLRKFKSRFTIKYATYQLLHRRNSDTVQPGRLLKKRVAEYITVMMSYKITSPERLKIFSTVLHHLHAVLAGSGISINVIDASDDEYLCDTKQLFQEITLPVAFKNEHKPLCQAYLHMLKQIPQQYVYLQFDDFMTVGLTPAFLQAACQLLEKYVGLVDVVCIMWPVDVSISETDHTINVMGFQQKSQNAQATYLFGYGTPQTPLFIEKIGDYEFGIFENFQYGFFFNHLITHTQSYLSRIQWYMHHISDRSVHTIELAASERTIGPFWTHLAICLSDVCLLDLDYAHTSEAVRHENKENRAFVEALNRGYVLKAYHAQC